MLPFSEELMAAAAWQSYNKLTNLCQAFYFIFKISLGLVGTRWEGWAMCQIIYGQSVHGWVVIAMAWWQSWLIHLLGSPKKRGSACSPPAFSLQPAMVQNLPRTGYKISNSLEWLFCSFEREIFKESTPYSKLFASFLIRAETERGLSRKHIIEGRYRCFHFVFIRGLVIRERYQPNRFRTRQEWKNSL